MEVLRGLAEPVRLRGGCVSYHLYRDVENRDVIAIVEEWRTREDLQRHIRSNDYRSFLGAMDLLSEPPQIKISDISETAGIQFVAATLGVGATAADCVPSCGYPAD